MRKKIETVPRHEVVKPQEKKELSFAERKVLINQNIEKLERMLGSVKDVMRQSQGILERIDAAMLEADEADRAELITLQADHEEVTREHQSILRDVEQAQIEAWKLLESIEVEEFIERCDAPARVGIERGDRHGREIDEERAAGILDTQEKLADAVRRRGFSEPGLEVLALTGNDTVTAQKLRKKLIEDGAHHGAVAESLAGIDSETAWNIREDILARETQHGRGLLFAENVARGLAGVDSERAWEMRKQLLRRGVDKECIADSLTGLDSPRALRMREEILEDRPDLEFQVMRSFAGVRSEHGDRAREKFIKEEGVTEAVVLSTIGLNTKKAWDIRREFQKNGGSYETLALSLAGLEQQGQALKMRKEMYEDVEEHSDERTGILRSLTRGMAGVAPQQFEEHDFRVTLRQSHVAEEDMALSYGGDPTTFVWQLKTPAQQYREEGV